MKTLLSVCLLLALSCSAFFASAQGVKISTSPGAPDNSAILDVESTTQGFAPPRMTTAERDLISNPVEGLMIYNLTTHCTETYRGAEFGWYIPCISFPSVTTGESPSEIYGFHAIVPGDVLSDGGSVVTSRGICWSTNPGPTILSNVATAGSGVGPFSAAITGLSPSTTYHAKAFATNSTWTSYGEEITFTTNTGIIAFTSSTSWTAPAGVTSVGVLVVAGGGGGGCDNGGGGGAGGVRYNSAFSVNPGSSYSIVVGAGGAGAPIASVPGSNGVNSSFSTLVSTGGGGGGSLQTNTGQNGASGGGGVKKPGPNATGGFGISGEGNDGGDSFFDYMGGGGGGASAVGADGTGSGAGNGGAGATYLGYTVGGGGGGGAGNQPPGAGGTGGGGAGAMNSNFTPVAGTANTGGGGGGGGGAFFAGPGANGGSGIVVLQF